MIRQAIQVCLPSFRVGKSSVADHIAVPDFYGEKISSVAGYRQWLKDQRAYNKKRTTFI